MAPPVVASRSFDWCPYCMRQIIQLQEEKAGFDAAGIGMVAITYDDPAVAAGVYRPSFVSPSPLCQTSTR